MAFTAEGWIEIAEVFKGSLEHVLANSKSFSQEGQDVISKFIYGFVMVNKPYMLATPLGVQHAVDTVFTNEIVRDFILTLAFVFSCRWGANTQRYAELVESIAFAVSASDASGHGRALNAIPQQILDELPRVDTVLPVLQENKWLVVLLLMQLTVQIPPISDGKKK
jgi:hypothetical protein